MGKAVLDLHACTALMSCPVFLDATEPEPDLFVTPPDAPFTVQLARVNLESAAVS